MIIGGGLTGLLAARELMLAGAKVIVVERGELARESSWAGGGILSPIYPWRYPEAVTALASWSQAHFGALAAEIQEGSGVDPEYLLSGMLVVEPEDETEASEWANSHDFELRLVDAKEVEALEPGLGSVGGLILPTVGQVRNPRLLRSLLVYLERNGVAFRPNLPVTGVKVNKGVACGIETQQGEMHADTVVLASGAWSGQLASDLGMSINIEPVKGQMLLFKAAPGVLKHIVLKSGHYVIPRKDGHILVGSTMERVGFDKEPTEQAYKELYESAVNILPKLADYPVVKHWAGLRPGSKSGIPCICAHPEVSGLYLSAGHFRNGVVMGPASARLLGDIILARAPIVEPAPYQV